MFTRLLVPLDGSARAERALPLAATVARASGATVLLLRMIDLTREAGAYGLVPAPTLGSTVHTLHGAAKAYLAEHKSSELLKGLAVETATELGDAAHGILDTAETWQADLLVMCSHGRTGLARWALGSVAEHVAHHALIPVLLLRESGPSLAGRHPDPEHLLRVLVSLDGTKLAAAVVEPAATLIEAMAAPQHGAMHLVTVLTPYEADPTNMPYALVVEGAKSYLERVAHDLRAQHSTITVTWSVVTELDIAHALIRVAENGEDAEGAGVFGGCDLIAMSTRGASGIVRWVMGSVTDRVLHATKLPTLIVHPSELPKR